MPHTGHFLYLDMALAACPAGNTSSCVALWALPIRATAWLCARRRRAACAHTPCMASGRSNAAPATPWLKSITKSITPACACVSSPSQNLQRPLCGRLFPLACHKRPLCGRHFPFACHKRPRVRASIPPRHLWRGGGRQAGGEVTRAWG